MSGYFPRRKKGFTLVELLVVMGIISILIAMLLPALRKAKENADAAKCQSNIKAMMTACLMFAQDHKNHLPGNDEDRGIVYPQPDAWKRDFLAGPPLGQPFIGFKDAPKRGTLWPYLRDAGLYRCPSVESSQNAGLGGQTSNERFDYAAFKSLSGAKLNKVKNTSIFRNPVNGVATQVPTPFLCQEQASLINQTNIEGGHSNEDAISIVHGGGSYYGSLDGSVHYFQEPKLRTKTGIRSDYSGVPLARYWRSQCTLNGREKDLGRPGTRFGQWMDIAANTSRFGW